MVRNCSKCVALTKSPVKTTTASCPVPDEAWAVLNHPKEQISYTITREYFLEILETNLLENEKKRNSYHQDEIEIHN